MKQRLLALFLSISLLTLLFGGCRNKQDDSIKRDGFALNTTVSVTLFDTKDETVLDACFAEISRLEKLLSRTIEGSDVWQLNHANGETVTVSDDTAAVLKKGLAYNKTSGGAFALTIGATSSLWDFQSETPAVPADTAINAAVATVDDNAVQLDGNRVRLQKSGAMIDLGGIAKGYIADKLRELLESKGVKNALIDLGGNILAMGSTEGKAFTIGVKNPLHDDYLAATVNVSQVRSIVTSGGYERGFEKDGVWYHHILDPKTGCPAETDVASVTIISDSSADGDALSTACYVLGLTEGMKLINSLDGIEAFFVGEDNMYYSSDGFSSVGGEVKVS